LTQQHIRFNFKRIGKGVDLPLLGVTSRSLLGKLRDPLGLSTQRTVIFRIGIWLISEIGIPINNATSRRSAGCSLLNTNKLNTITTIATARELIHQILLQPNRAVPLTGGIARRERSASSSSTSSAMATMVATTLSTSTPPTTTNIPATDTPGIISTTTPSSNIGGSRSRTPVNPQILRGATYNPLPNCACRAHRVPLPHIIHNHLVRPFPSREEEAFHDVTACRAGGDISGTAALVVVWQQTTADGGCENRLIEQWRRAADDGGG
jgi:hypothetical protein